VSVPILKRTIVTLEPGADRDNQGVTCAVFCIGRYLCLGFA